MEKDSFEEVRRASKKGEYDDTIDISPTGYGYVPVEKARERRIKRLKN